LTVELWFLTLLTINNYGRYLKKFDGIIFDIDGTLTETNNLIFASFNHVAQKYWGKTLTPEEITKYFGPTEQTIFKQLFKEHFDEVMEDYYKFYRKNHKLMAKAFDGIPELISELKTRGILLSIYTGKGRTTSLITLEEIGLIDKFDMIVSGDDIKGHKPSPEGIELFIKKYNLKRYKVLMVGDAPPDIKAARAAGIKIASVLWDSYAKDEVLKMNSDFYFKKVEELKKFLLKE